MTYHLLRRATAQPFKFVSQDPYWANAADYAACLRAIQVDAIDNYSGGSSGPRPERGMLTNMLGMAALQIEEVIVPYVVERHTRSADRAAYLDMFNVHPCYPYSARHYANIVEDLRDYAVSRLATKTAEHIVAFGTLPALLTQLAHSLNELTKFERRPPVDVYAEFVDDLARQPVTHEVHEFRPINVASALGAPYGEKKDVTG